MKILILGGTGAMGTHLVDLLNIKENEVLVTSRSSKDSLGKVSFISGNAKEIDFLSNLLINRWDVIVDFMVYNTGEFYERINLFLDSTSQYIFLSSARVYADSEKPMKETSSRLLDISTDKEFLGTDEYALSKCRQENILKQSGKNNWTIIRPYITYSSQRLQLGVFEKEDWLYRALNGKTIVFSEEINKCVTTMTSGFDVAKGIVPLVGNREAFGETFHITSPQPYKWSDILDIYLTVLEKHLGYRPKVFLDNIENLKQYHDAPYQVKYDRLFNRTFDNSKIMKYVDVYSFTTAEEGLKESLEKFIENPKFKNIDWRKEAVKDMHTKEVARIKEIPGFKQRINYILNRFFISQKLLLCQIIILARKMCK